MFSLKVELWVGVSYNLFWKKVGTWSLDQLQFRLPTYVTWSCWCEEWCVHSSVCEFSPPQPQPAGLLLMGVAGHTFILLQSLRTLNWNENQMISSTPLVKSGFMYCQTYSPCQTSSSNGKEAPTPASTVNVRKGRSRSKRTARCLQGSRQRLKGQWSLSVAGSCGRILSKTCENVVNLFCFGNKSDQPGGSLFVEWIAPQEARA